MKKIDLSSLVTIGKLPKMLFVSVKNIGKGIKMPHELHLCKFDFIIDEVSPNTAVEIAVDGASKRLQGNAGFGHANGAIYELRCIDFRPELKNTDEAKQYGGWIFAKLRIHGFIGDNGGMSIVGGSKAGGSTFLIPLSEEDIEIFEIEQFT